MGRAPIVKDYVDYLLNSLLNRTRSLMRLKSKQHVSSGICVMTLTDAATLHVFGLNFSTYCWLHLNVSLHIIACLYASHFTKSLSSSNIFKYDPGPTNKSFILIRNNDEL